METMKLKTDMGEAIGCPVCGFEYTHLDGAPVTVDGADGPKPQWAGRGPALSIPFTCENGCRFNVILGSHKGWTYLTSGGHVKPSGK